MRIDKTATYPQTFLLREDLHLLVDLVAPPGERHLEGEVAAHLALRVAVPLLVGL